jgi:hypothetical protein
MKQDLKARDHLTENDTDEFQQQCVQSVKPTDFHSKMEDFLLRKDFKLRALREEKARQEVAGCVFSPNIYTRKAGEHTQPRGLGQFLQDQMRFVENVR